MVSRGVVCKRPLIPILRGFAFDDSEFDTEIVYVWVFVLPLYVPTKHLTFTFGHRLENRTGLLKSSDRWRLSATPDPAEITSMLDAMRSKGTRFLDSLSDPQSLIDHLTPATRLVGNIFVKEAIAYSFARVGKLDEARRRLEDLCRSVKQSDPWRHIAGNAAQLLAAVNAGQDETDAQLEAWIAESLQTLHMESAALG